MTEGTEDVLGQSVPKREAELEEVGARLPVADTQHEPLVERDCAGEGALEPVVMLERELVAVAVAVAEAVQEVKTADEYSMAIPSLEMERELKVPVTEFEVPYRTRVG